MCTEANNQREAYSSVEALDIEANGSDGVVRLNITPTVLNTEGEYVTMTGCRQPSKWLPELLSYTLHGLTLNCVYIYNIIYACI